MSLFKLFDLNYLLDPAPGYYYSYNWLFLIGFLLVFGLSFKAAKYLKERPHAKLEEQFFGAIPELMRWLAIIGLILNFFRDQNIPFLGMRIWLVLLLLTVPAYAGYVWKRYELKFDDKQEKNKKSEDKYIPKPKKKKKSKKRK